ncbi:hypothetical protein H1R20_g10467, partial [Candolleomyces eurysporus]
MSYSPEELARFAQLYSLNLIPLRVILASLTWVIYDYFATLEDEVRYIWSQKWCLGKFLFLFIRYYTLLLLVFDVLQIHLFATPGVPSLSLCVSIDPAVRLSGAISLWTIEIIMQLRIYALFNCSRKIAIFNGVLFLISIVAFMGIMVHGVMRRAALIASAIHFPLPGCPVINGGLQWTLWMPATGFEMVLCAFVLYKGLRSVSVKIPFHERPTLVEVLIGDNILYFVGIAGLLIFNNVMAIGTTTIPWFSYGPFHAGMGIMTTHMLIHLRKVAVLAEFTELSDDDGNDNNIMGSDTHTHLPKFLVSGSSDSIYATSTIVDTDIERSAEMQERSRHREENRLVEASIQQRYTAALGADIEQTAEMQERSHHSEENGIVEVSIHQRYTAALGESSSR